MPTLISEEQWARYRNTIRSLYLAEGKPLHTLMAEMKEKNGFVASKSQYEAKLKQWGFSKNLTQHHWRYAIHRIRKRERQHMKSEVVYCGVRLPSSKVDKARARYGYQTTLERVTHPPSPKEPAELMLLVRTPPPESVETMWPWNLPWICFMEGREEGTASLVRVWQARVPENHLTIQVANEATMQYFGLQFEALTISERFSHISTTLASVMPERQPGEHLIRAHDLCCPQDIAFASAGLETMLYLVSNNLHLCTEVFDLQLMSILKVSRLTERTAQLLLSSKAPTSQALAEKLYGMAARTTDMDVIVPFLKAGMDASLQIPSQYLYGWTDTWMVTALEIAIRAENIEIVQLLLRHGGDVCGVHLRVAGEIASSSSRRNITRLLLPNMNLSLRSQRDTITAILHLVYVGDCETVDLLLYEMWRRCAQLSLEAKIAILIAAIFYQYDEIVDSLVETDIDVSVTVQDTKFRKFSAIWAALTVGRYDYCERILRKGVPPDAIVYFPSPQPQATCLQYAAKIGDSKMIRLLLKYGADINHCHDDEAGVRYIHGEFFLAIFGKTALEAAILGKQVEAAMWLQAAGAKTSGSELIISILKRLPQLVEHFLDGMEYRLSDSERQLCVQAAIASDQLELTKHFLGTCGQLSREAKRACTWTAIKYRRFRFADLILEGEYNPDLLCAAVHMAVLTKESSHVLSLLRRRQESASQDNSCLPEGTALGLCIHTGDWDLLRILISHGIHADSGIELDEVIREDIFGARETIERGASYLGWWIRENHTTSSQISPLAMAVDAGCKKTVMFLLEQGYVPCPTAFCRAARRGQVGLLKVFLAAQPGLIARIPDSQTALSLAIGNRKMEVVNFLLHAGADVNPPPPSGDFLYRITTTSFLDDTKLRTPLQAAAEIGDAKLVDLLLKRGANVNAPPGPQSGATALQLAAIYGYIGIVRKLIGLGADCNAPGAESEGRTALEGAAEHGRLDVVQLLLESGTMTEGTGRPQYFAAIKFARRHGHFAVANLLENFRTWTTEDRYIWAEIGSYRPEHVYFWFRRNYETFRQTRNAALSVTSEIPDDSSEEYHESPDLATDHEQGQSKEMDVEIEDIVRDTEGSIDQGGQAGFGDVDDIAEGEANDLLEECPTVEETLCSISAAEDWFDQFITFPAGEDGNEA